MSISLLQRWHGDPQSYCLKLGKLDCKPSSFSPKPRHPSIIPICPCPSVHFHGTLLIGQGLWEGMSQSWVQNWSSTRTLTSLIYLINRQCSKTLPSVAASGQWETAPSGSTHPSSHLTEMGAASASCEKGAVRTGVLSFSVDHSASKPWTW